MSGGLRVFLVKWVRVLGAIPCLPEEISTKAQGLIGTDSLILKRASHHFMACLVTCLSGEKNLNNVSFLSQGGFITSSFLQVSQG